MWNLVIWMVDKIPEVINDAETRYCVCNWDKFAKEEIRIAGVVKPANIDNACCRPNNSPKRIGMSSLMPKKGCVFFWVKKGNVGVNK